MTTSPKILNLDELPTPEAAMTIVHKGVSYPMVEFTVQGFIDQQLRAEAHQQIVNAAGAGAGGGDITERKAIEIMKEAIESFFPTLPLAEMPTRKMFQIFAWLNAVGAKMNEDGASSAEATPAGNGEGETS